MMHLFKNCGVYNICHSGKLQLTITFWCISPIPSSIMMPAHHRNGGSSLPMIIGHGNIGGYVQELYHFPSTNPNGGNAQLHNSGSSVAYTCWPLYTIIPVIIHFYLGFNSIISWIARVVNFIENVYHIRVWKALSKCTNFSDVTVRSSK